MIDIVKNAIDRQAVLVANLKKLLTLHKNMVKRQQRQVEKERTLIQDKIQKYKNESFSLYEKYRAGELSQSEFMKLRQTNKNRLEIYQKQAEEFAGNEDADSADGLSIFSLLEGKEQIAELTRDTVEQLVSEIYVYDRERIEIVFKFKDEMAFLLEMLKVKKVI